MRASLSLVLATAIVALWILVVATKTREGFWSNQDSAPGYVALTRNNFPGADLGYFMGNVNAAADKCAATPGCVGFVVKRGDISSSKRPYWLLSSKVVVPANRKDNAQFTAYVTKQHWRTQFKGQDAATASNDLLASGAKVVGCAGAAITVYADKDYSGDSKWYGCGEYPNIGLEWKNDAITSIAIPTGLKVQIFMNKDFGGASATLTESTKNIGDTNGIFWNDAITSIKVSKA